MSWSDTSWFTLVIVRIAIVAESFPPDVNGVAHCTLRIVEHLVDRGHEPLVIAPAPARGAPGAAGPFPCPVTRLRSMPVPVYRNFRISTPGPALGAAVAGHRAELVHLASPFVLGSGRQPLPTIALYQTDMPGYARVYRTGPLGEAAAWHWVRRIHNAADRTLAASTASADSLRAHGVERVWVWGRGVDTRLFDPAKRNERLRRELAPGGEVLIGYVGRLAPEKRVDLLAQVAEVPGARLVIVGGGPAEAALRRAMPGAVFLGPRYGPELAQVYASLDIFVHSGARETFGQTLQEAAASGLPVVAPAAGGPLDLVSDGVTGFLVPPEAPGPLAAAVSRLVRDPAMRAAMGQAGLKKVTGHTWPVLCDELIGHYEAILGSTGTAERQHDDDFRGTR
ncbi:MAG TPA: glycosyltransferase family 1 protein [Streptosporangiaceae bacterium]|nr:glycosyltransferase family 1 protein [Streptosporangiaceae bacterium]